MCKQRLAVRAKVVLKGNLLANISGRYGRSNQKWTKFITPYFDIYLSFPTQNGINFNTDITVAIKMQIHPSLVSPFLSKK